MLTTTVFLDFAQDLSGTYASTVGQLASVAGPGENNRGTGTNLKVFAKDATSSLPSGLITDGYNIRFSPFDYDYNGDNIANSTDLAEIGAAVLPLVERIFEPFDLFNDSDISFRDETGPANVPNGVPDFAYVTGTGGSDVITITGTSSMVNVVLQPYLESADGSARVAQDSFSYSFDISQTDGEILIDGGRGNDQIIIHDNVPAEFRIRFDVGDDILDIVQTNNPQTGSIEVDGGDGDDVLNGGPGADILKGGSGEDILNGGAGEDQYFVEGGTETAPLDTVIDNIITQANSTAAGGGVNSQSNKIQFESGGGTAAIKLSYDFGGYAGTLNYNFAWADDTRFLLKVTAIDELFEILGGTTANNSDFDFNSMNNVDGTDFFIFVQDVLGTMFGDVNLDGHVNASDLNTLGLHWQENGTLSWADGNLNGDNKVNAMDLNLLAANWQFSNGN